MAETKKATAKPKAKKEFEVDPQTGKTLSEAHGTGLDESAKEGYSRTDAEDGPVKDEHGVERFTTIGDGAAPSPPGWKFGDRWNSDDARKAYRAEGTTLEAEQTKGAEGEPPGTAREHGK